jgi:predicted neuraminidase
MGLPIVVTAFVLLAGSYPAGIDGGFIYERAPFPSAHASTIIETGPGEFLAAWFGGTREGAKDVAIWGARLAGGRWSKPFEIVREPEIATYNPVLYYSKDGVLWLSYKFGPSPETWTGALMRSTNNGKTWSKPEHLPAHLFGPIKNKPLLLADGTLVSGSSAESYQAWSVWVERSQDHGKTWTKHGPVVFPGVNKGIIQPAIVPLPGGGLRMYVRSTQAIGSVCYADSQDGGVTWTAAKRTSLPNPNSGLDAVALRDGRIVLVYNHTGKGRSPLNVAVSADGTQWNNFLALETEPGEFSYPAVIQAANGDVHVTYTWNRKNVKHVRIPADRIPR